ncbi:succinyldiaminopimelate transaminase [Corynebacterium mendelii]|uniref:Succinyldiaminopimelate transaminase n=1 Tax=Corynebacterium mendelii TaxID=2765362 RepID=A0A939IXU5_9CORY|nr:succinyldiaminopimelate transaminase [Corynebacterium mendelii]MBN9644840.1 succinyldiaminopimelate transaminase [Corynebacterium mendelii]
MSHPPRTPAGANLPDFPWDTIAEAKKTAAAHPDGLINLSVGTPVDEVSPIIQLAVAEAAGFPGYPTTHGTDALRDAIVNHCRSRYNMVGCTTDAVLPVIGTKELIAGLPSLLGIGAGHTVVIPEIAYPTYEVSAIMSGARCVRADSLTQLGPSSPTLMFINSPGNPTGKVLGVNHLKKVVDFARERDCIVAADECYIGLGWNKDNPPVSILDEEVCGGDTRNLLAIHSLSKSSNLASYRAGWLMGDGSLIGELLAVRKHTGFMVPWLVQQAMIAALNNPDQEKLQYLRYAARREMLVAALTEAGFRIDNSEAGLYLWATRGEDCRKTLDWFASLGILVAPGDFYGPRGTNHVRIALTGTDQQCEQAGWRIVRAA